MFEPGFGLGFLAGFAAMGGLLVLAGFGAIWWRRYIGEFEPILPVPPPPAPPGGRPRDPVGEATR